MLEETKWFGPTSLRTVVNQNSERAVRSLPLFGIPYQTLIDSSRYHTRGRGKVLEQAGVKMANGKTSAIV